MKNFLDLLINSVNDWAASTDDSSKDASAIGVVATVKAFFVANPVTVNTCYYVGGVVFLGGMVIGGVYFYYKQSDRLDNEKASSDVGSTPRSPDGGQ